METGRLRDVFRILAELVEEGTVDRPALESLAARHGLALPEAWRA